MSYPLDTLETHTDPLGTNTGVFGSDNKRGILLKTCGFLNPEEFGGDMSITVLVATFT